jgi:hypothetical protein
MYQTTLHNKDVHEDLVANKGVYVARYEQADELTEDAVELRPAIEDEVD